MTDRFERLVIFKDASTNRDFAVREGGKLVKLIRVEALSD